MANWAQLPPEMVDLIAQKSASMEDLITFMVVCKSWSSSVAPLLNNMPHRYPWLMLAGEKNTEYHSERGFFNLSTGIIHKLHLPEVSGPRRCVGGYKRWLLILGLDFQMSLLHPFSRRQIHLPSLLTYSQLDDEVRNRFVTFFLDTYHNLFTRKCISGAHHLENT